jgi:hypothetical protein
MYDYHRCAASYITNCSAAPVATDMSQLTVFLDYVEKAGNRECPGGLTGCIIPFSEDKSCIDRVSYFLEQNERANHARSPHLSYLSIWLIVILHYRIN